jgi:hypothetical protein
MKKQIGFKGAFERWIYWIHEGHDVNSPDLSPLEKVKSNIIYNRKYAFILNDIPVQEFFDFLPDCFVGWWDSRKHKVGEVFKPGKALKDRKEGAFIIEIPESKLEGCPPFSLSISGTDIPQGTIEHLLHIFPPDSFTNRLGSLNHVLAVKEGRSPLPEKIGAKADKKLEKIIKKQKLTDTDEELELFDLGFKYMPDLSNFTRVKSLNLGWNDELESIYNIGHMENLEELILESSGVNYIGEDIGNLPNLRLINLYHCSYLAKLPESLRGHKGIEVLYSKGCPVSLDVDFICSLPNLKEVYLPIGLSVEGHRIEGSEKEVDKMVNIISKKLPNCTIHRTEWL